MNSPLSAGFITWSVSSVETVIIAPFIVLPEMVISFFVTTSSSFGASTVRMFVSTGVGEGCNGA